jgi:hypothetical protein
MSQDFGWLKQQGDKPEPRMEFITTLWRMRGTSGRNIECAAFRVETGLELRTMYSPEEIIASQLFRGVGADEKLAEAADRWRLNLLAKGFFDLGPPRWRRPVWNVSGNWLETPNTNRIRRKNRRRARSCVVPFDHDPHIAALQGRPIQVSPNGSPAL